MSNSYLTIAQIYLTQEGAWLNGHPLATEGTGRAMLTALYKQEVGDYPKFYKMDPLARVGFLAAELLIKATDAPLSSCGASQPITNGDESQPTENGGDETRAVILVNRSASVAADRKYEETIIEGENYFPSPGDFVYTLPNIVTGEIAIRHGYYGETTFLVIDQYDPTRLDQLIAQAFCDPMTQTVLGGWVECQNADQFEVRMGLYQREA